MSDLTRNLKKYCENQYIDKLTTDAANRIDDLEAELNSACRTVEVLFGAAAADEFRKSFKWNKPQPPEET